MTVDVNALGVIGAGTMGTGIAQVAAGLAQDMTDGTDGDVYSGTAIVEQRTRFRGDFGAAVISEIEVHDSIFEAQDIPGKFNDRALHTQTYT